jgi:hypothetical protein
VLVVAGCFGERGLEFSPLARGHGAWIVTGSGERPSLRPLPALQAVESGPSTMVPTYCGSAHQTGGGTRSGEDGE